MKLGEAILGVVLQLALFEINVLRCKLNRSVQFKHFEFTTKDRH